MTLLWFDGFEGYNSSEDIQALPNLDANNLSFGTSYGRRSSRGIRIDQYDDRYYLCEVTGEPNTIILGFAFKAYSIGSYSSTSAMVRIYDKFLLTNIHLKFHINSSKLIEVRNNAGTLLGTTSGHVIEVNTWYYIEIKAYIHDSAGTVEIKVDEIQRLSLTSQDTCNGTNVYVGAVRLGVHAQNSTCGCDDLYVCDDSGSKNNDFLGDVRIDVVRPNGVGAHTDFSPSAGSNYQNVDETYPDDDTTYNDSQDVAVGEQDSYAMESLDVIGSTIHGVKDQITVRKTDAGARSVKVLTRQGGSDYLGDTIILSDTFTTHARIMENNPDDAAAFVEADITSGEVGVEVTV